MRCAKGWATRRTNRQPALIVVTRALRTLHPVLLGATLGAAVVGVAWSIDAVNLTRRSARLHRVLVDLMLNTLSAGDPVTERHSRRVADLADVLFHRFGIPAREHARLRIAALFHDLGKIDDRFFPILHSCAPLSPSERAMIEEHPQEGADMLEPLESVHPGLSKIVGAHHECWDGQGYPEGLKGEEIPLGARIISVADVFDALTQPRSYREPFTIDAALEEIRRGSGSRFDPRIVASLQDPEVRDGLAAIAAKGLADERAQLAEEDDERAESINGSPTPRAPSEPRSGTAEKVGSPADRSNSR